LRPFISEGLVAGGGVLVPITVTAGNTINNYYGEPNKKERQSAQDVINQLEYDDLWRSGKSNIHDDGVMRLDNQGSYGSDPTWYNIQIQVDGVSGSSTVAHALVSDEIQTDDPINQTGAKNKVLSALQQSLDYAVTYTVEGSIP
jgi:hypothetical protein